MSYYTLIYPPEICAPWLRNHLSISISPGGVLSWRRPWHRIPVERPSGQTGTCLNFSTQIHPLVVVAALMNDGAATHMSNMAGQEQHGILKWSNVHRILLVNVHRHNHTSYFWLHIIHVGLHVHYVQRYGNDNAHAAVLRQPWQIQVQVKTMRLKLTLILSHFSKAPLFFCGTLAFLLKGNNHCWNGIGQKHLPNIKRFIATWSNVT